MTHYLYDTLPYLWYCKQHCHHWLSGFLFLSVQYTLTLQTFYHENASYYRLIRDKNTNTKTVTGATVYLLVYILRFLPIIRDDDGDSAPWDEN